MEFLGLPDEAFIRSKVPMTKQEIRILTLAKAHIKPDAIIYDIGAGTGSLSIEAARLAPSGEVYALERNSEGIKLIRANAANFSLTNITAIETEAPAGIEGLPAPDTVLIGGSGGNLTKIFDATLPRLRAGGRLVLNCITMQTLAVALEYLHAHTEYEYEAVQVQINRLTRVGGYDIAKAINPIYIVTCYHKQEE